MQMLVAVFGISLVLGICLTYLMRPLSVAIGMVDNPDGRRKLHAANIPLSGGLPILAALVMSVLFAMTADNTWRARLISEAGFLLTVAIAAGVIIVVGMIDDRFGIRGRQKLAGQILAVGIVLLSGMEVSRLSVFGLELKLGHFGYVFTAFWLLGAINAFNLIDGADGLATSIGIIISLALGAMAVANGHGHFGVIAIALAGSLGGFLVFNFPPARIFLGDAGSMLTGLMLGTLAIRSSLKGPATAALVVPIAIWAIPIFDVSMAILRRKLTGRSLYTTDRGHLHHCLLNRGYSGRKTLAWIGVLSALAAIGAVVSASMRSELMAAISGLTVVLILVVSGLFGRAELGLLTQRVRNLVVSMVPNSRIEVSNGVRSRFQGDRNWDELWHAMVEFAEDHGLSAIELNVNHPAIGEEYHASWSTNSMTDLSDLPSFQTDFPLLSKDGLCFGRIRLSGISEQSSACRQIAGILEGLEPFATEMQDLVSVESIEDSEFEPATVPMTNQV